MTSRHFRLSAEPTGAIAFNQFFNQFVTDIYIYIYILTIKTRLMCIHVCICIYKRASLACAVMLSDICVRQKGDNISKYVCLTVIIDIARKITKLVNF